VSQACATARMFTLTREKMSRNMMHSRAGNRENNNTDIFRMVAHKGRRREAFREGYHTSEAIERVCATDPTNLSRDTHKGRERLKC